MSIELYDKGAVIFKDDVIYYMLKYGSKNTFTCGGQYTIDDSFKSKFKRRQSRASDWRVIAIGTIYEHMGQELANTYWNAPTSQIYGRIMFGNKMNIALSLCKQKPLLYKDLEESQRANIDKIIAYSKTFIDLQDIKEDGRCKDTRDYCGTEYHISKHCIEYKKARYWNLDNL